MAVVPNITATAQATALSHGGLASPAGVPTGWGP